MAPTIQVPHATLVLRGLTQRVDMFVRDENGDPVDATSVSLGALDSSETVLFEETFPPGSRVSLAGVGTGNYFVTWGAGSGENDVATDYLLRWSATTATGTTNEVQVVKVVSASTARMISYFRLYLDKALLAAGDGTDGCSRPGWTDAQLAMCLENGLTLINAYQPYPTWSSLEEYPDVHRQVLLDAGLAAGVMTQQIYSIATDIDSYSDNGHAFTVVHNPKLAAVYQQIVSRLDTLVPAMKKHYVRSGRVRLEVGPNFRLAYMVATSPYGTFFPNLFAAAV